MQNPDGTPQIPDREPLPHDTRYRQARERLAVGERAGWLSLAEHDSRLRRIGDRWAEEETKWHRFDCHLPRLVWARLSPTEKIRARLHFRARRPRIWKS